MSLLVVIDMLGASCVKSWSNTIVNKHQSVAHQHNFGLHFLLLLLLFSFLLLVIAGDIYTFSL